MSAKEISNLKAEIAKCTLCRASFAHDPNPIVRFSPKSKIVIIGQAPGAIVHRTGIPWHDKSGDNLRKWMGVTDEQFYNEDLIAIVPMGFCYPGKGKSGDLPPSKECAPQWHDKILEYLNDEAFVLLIGKYAQDYYLNDKTAKNLTETVKNFKNYLPTHFVLPHPSPRNNIWMKKNPWFGEAVLPELKAIVKDLL